MATVQQVVQLPLERGCFMVRAMSRSSCSLMGLRIRPYQTVLEAYILFECLLFDRLCCMSSHLCEQLTRSMYVTTMLACQQLLATSIAFKSRATRELS